MTINTLHDNKYKEDKLSSEGHWKELNQQRDGILNNVVKKSLSRCKVRTRERFSTTPTGLGAAKSTSEEKRRFWTKDPSMMQASSNYWIMKMKINEHKLYYTDDGKIN